MSSSSAKKKLLYVAYPIAFAAVIVLMLAVGMSGLCKKALDQWKMVWISGAPSYTYSEDLATGDISESQRTKIEDKISTGELYGRISSEDLDIDGPIYYSDTEDILSNGVGTYAGGALPGEEGISIIGGHDGTYFAGLENAKAGDAVTIETTYGTYTYTVESTEVLDVADAQSWYEGLSGNKTVLYTCYPFGEDTSERSERFIVYLTAEDK